jgi:hypothetical protein
VTDWNTTTTPRLKYDYLNGRAVGWQLLRGCIRFCDHASSAVRRFVSRTSMMAAGRPKPLGCNRATPGCEECVTDCVRGHASLTFRAGHATLHVAPHVVSVNQHHFCGVVCWRDVQDGAASQCIAPERSSGNDFAGATSDP